MSLLRDDQQLFQGLRDVEKSCSHADVQFSVMTQQIYTIVLELRDSARGIDTRFTYFQPPVRVEDALGRVFPFPAECSVEALSCELKFRFREGACMEEVMAGSFEVFNFENQDQILTISDRSGLVSGMSIKMVVILTIEIPDREECPEPRWASEDLPAFLPVGDGRSWYLRKKEDPYYGRAYNMELSRYLRTCQHRTRNFAKKPWLCLTTRRIRPLKRRGQKQP